MKLQLANVLDTMYGYNIRHISGMKLLPAIVLKTSTAFISSRDVVIQHTV
jgi:hypothetical protein